MAAALPKLWLKPGREKSLRRRHPWVFSGAVERLDGSPEAGASVEIVTAAGELLGRGAYSPASQIRARVWSFVADENIDAAFFRRRLARAIESRRSLGLLEPRGACRLVFSESDGLPGLIVDRYGDYLVCQFLSAGAESWRAKIVELLVELCAPAGIYERSEGGARHKEGLPSRRGVLAGADPPREIEVVAGDIRLVVDVANGQKTGAYLDQQRNRQRVAAHARGGDVLDAFSYTGGFSIACLRAGATSATLVDSSVEALALAERETASNAVRDQCRFVTASVFDELRNLRETRARFDLVVLDPPKFVHSADQVNAGSRGYKDINMLGLALVRPGGVLATFSCSGHVEAALFQKIVAGAAVDAGRTAQILERLTQPPDHPVATEFPEGEYLKGLILRVH
jgi:23S rRNA (cytosine1962-C5)-methyltransferase